MRTRPENITPETKVVPSPVAMVMQNLDAITDAYRAARRQRDPSGALVAAIDDVLPAEETTQVLAFLRGEDDRFGRDTGPSFAKKTLEHLEGVYSYKRGIDLILSEAPEGRTTPQPTNDVVDLAEWLAGNKQTSYVYRRTLKEYPDLAASILENAINDLLAIASRAWTKTGRKVKIEQAEKVVILLGNKARAHPDPAAMNQVVWCDALAARLRDLRK